MERILDQEGPRPERQAVTLSPEVLEDAALHGIVIPDDLEERDPVSGYLWRNLVRMVPNPLGLSLAEVRECGAIRKERVRREKAERDDADADAAD